MVHSVIIHLLFLGDNKLHAFFVGDKNFLIIFFVGVTLLPNMSYLIVSTNHEENLFSVQLSPSADCCGEVSYQFYKNETAFPLTAGRNSPVFHDSKPGRYV